MLVSILRLNLELGSAYLEDSMTVAHGRQGKECEEMHLEEKTRAKEPTDRQKKDCRNERYERQVERAEQTFGPEL